MVVSLFFLFAVGAAAEDIPYRVRFSGVDDRTLLNDLKSVSDMIALRQRPPGSMRQLKRRAERDVSRFDAVLRSNGYYDARIEIDMYERKRYVRVRFEIEPGIQYTIQRIDVKLVDAVDPARAERYFRHFTSSRLREPARAQTVLQLQDRLIRILEHEGRPFARKVSRRVEIEHSRQAMYLHFELERGPSAGFGPMTFTGLNRVQPRLIKRTIDWDEGETFDGAKLRAFQRRMMDLGLFSSARIIRAPELDENGRLPLEVEFSERKHRTLVLGAGYRSDEGVSGGIGFEHRNLRGVGERFSTQLLLSEIGYEGVSRYVKPHFRRLDQNFSVTLRAALEDPDAYRSQTLGALLAVDRPLFPNIVGSAGIGFRYAELREEDREDEEFGLIYVPLSLDWDGSDDIFDPRSGSRVSLSLAPYRDVIDSEVTFTKVRISGTRYQRLTRRPQLDLAGRVVLGQIAGAGRDSIPADERLYAGGGGSVRGYAFQSVGPLDGKRPLGGKSLVLASIELRWRLGSDFGLVAFTDGGVVQEESWPEDWSDVLWGAGVGFRYFTPVGPLRFDLAVPMDRRAGIDDSFQFYISLGQAF